MNDSIRLTGMSGLEIRALTTDELMGLTPLQVASLTSIQLHALTTAQLSVFSPFQLSELTKAQKAVLSPRQLEAMGLLKEPVKVEPRKPRVFVEVSVQKAPVAAKADKPVPSPVQVQPPVAKPIEVKPIEVRPVAAAPAKTTAQPEPKHALELAELIDFGVTPGVAPKFEKIDSATQVSAFAAGFLKTRAAEQIVISRAATDDWLDRTEPAFEFDFEPPRAAHKARRIQPKARPMERSHFNPARSAVYVAAMVVLTSGDFLTGAYSQEADTLNTIWNAREPAVQMQVLAAPDAQGPDEVAGVLTQLPMAATPERVSGLVMPPESATPTGYAQLPAQASPAFAKSNPALPSQAAVSQAALVQSTPNNYRPAVTSALPPQVQSKGRESERPTVALVEVPPDDKLKQLQLCTVTTPAAPGQSAMEKYMKEVASRGGAVLASIGSDHEVLRLSQATPASRDPQGQPSAPVNDARMKEVVKTTVKSNDPDRYNSSSWTSMQVSGDLPPKIAALGEDLISVVQKELPGDKRKNDAMPFDEFKLRVKEAVVASPDVGIVSSQLGQTQSGKSVAYASMLPQVTGTADSGKRNIGRDPYLNTPGYSRNGANYGITVSQLLFDFGASLFGFKAGEARVLAAQELLNSKRSEQALKSINAFVEFERAKAHMILAKQNASSRLAIVKLVKERSEIGGGTKADIIRVESKYAEALSTISLAETRLANAEEAYRELFGSSPKGVVHGPLHEFAIEGLSKTAEELAGTYPGLLQLAKLREASQSDYNSAVAKTLPSFQLVYGNTVNAFSAPSPVEPSRNSSLLVQLKYEFYTGGADTARKNDAMYKAQQAQQEFESGMRQYQKVLSQSQAEIRNNDELIAARKVSALSAIDSMRAVREQFSFNKGSLLDLITVQESLFMSGRDLIDAMADRALVRYRLLHLTAELDKMFELNTLASLNARD